MNDPVPNESTMAWTADADGLLTWAAPWWLELSATAEEGMDGGAWHRILHPQDLAPTFEAWTRAIESGQPYAQVHRVKLSDGLWHRIRSRGVPRYDEHGAVLEWTGYVDLDVEEPSE